MTKVNQHAVALTKAAEALNRAGSAADEGDTGMMMALHALAGRWMELAQLLPAGDDLTGRYDTVNLAAGIPDAGESVPSSMFSR